MYPSKEDDTTETMFNWIDQTIQEWGQAKKIHCSENNNDTLQWK